MALSRSTSNLAPAVRRVAVLWTKHWLDCPYGERFGPRHTRCLFANFLSDGGIYIVEDVYCDYRRCYRDSRISFIDFVRALIDAMHAHYQVTTSETNFQVGHPNRIREVSVPAITPILGAIEIYDSLVVVRRATRGLTRSTHRT